MVLLDTPSSSNVNPFLFEFESFPALLLFFKSLFSLDNWAVFSLYKYKSFSNWVIFLSLSFNDWLISSNFFSSRLNLSVNVRLYSNNFS